MASNEWWLQRVKGIYSYGISPFYQKAFGPDYRLNWRAAGRNFFGVAKMTAIPMIYFVGLTMWANNWIERAHRKDPDDYLDEE